MKFCFFLISDNIKAEKVLNKKPPATRRKRKTAAGKSTLSESSDEEEKKSTGAKTRRSRSKSTEVSRKRGRPRKIQHATTTETINPKR